LLFTAAKGWTISIITQSYIQVTGGNRKGARPYLLQQCPPKYHASQRAYMSDWVSRV